MLVERVARSVLDAHRVVLTFERDRALDCLFELGQPDPAEHLAVALQPFMDDQVIRVKHRAADLVERQRAQDGQADQESSSVPGAEAEGDRAEG